MGLYYVSTDRGCGIRCARTLASAEKVAREEVGTGNVEIVRRATKKDLQWVRAMGGYVPTDRYARGTRRTATEATGA